MWLCVVAKVSDVAVVAVVVVCVVVERGTTTIVSVAVAVCASCRCMCGWVASVSISLKEINSKLLVVFYDWGCVSWQGVSRHSE